jgi:hypothetical protein
MLNLLSDIKQLQAGENDTFYPEGLFPSQRRHPVTGITREDDNLFFTALIVFTLQRLKKYFSADELKIAEEIRQQAQKAFPLYKNREGEHTYNFWRKEKNAHFPNSKIFSKFKRFRLPDDTDVTALIYLADGYSGDDIIYLKNKLLSHSNNTAGIAKNTLPGYRNLKLYSTWFGKRMPIEIDICVITNLLYLIFESKAPLNENDLDCIRFISSVITHDEHKTEAFKIAPFYPQTSVILYHVSRLMTIADHPLLLQLKPKLLTDISEKLAGKTHPVEKIILHTSLLWLGEPSEMEELEMPDDFSFSWFIAGIITSVDNSLAGILSPLPLFHFHFYCEAYIKTLYLEYIMEKNKIKR